MAINTRKPQIVLIAKHYSAYTVRASSSGHKILRAVRQAPKEIILVHRPIVGEDRRARIGIDERAQRHFSTQHFLELRFGGRGWTPFQHVAGRRLWNAIRQLCRGVALHWTVASQQVLAPSFERWKYPHLRKRASQRLGRR